MLKNILIKLLIFKNKGKKSYDLLGRVHDTLQYKVNQTQIRIVLQDRRKRSSRNNKKEEI